MFHWLVGFCRRYRLRFIVFVFGLAVAPVGYALWISAAARLPQPIVPVARRFIALQEDAVSSPWFGYLVIFCLSIGLAAVIILWTRLSLR